MKGDLKPIAAKKIENPFKGFYLECMLCLLYMIGIITFVFLLIFIII